MYNVLLVRNTCTCQEDIHPWILSAITLNYFYNYGRLLKTADECLAPYENACTNNTSFSSFKEIGKLKDVLCKGTVLVNSLVLKDNFFMC